MAKIIQLPTAGPLLPEDYTVVFQGGRTKKVSVAALGGAGSITWNSLPGKPAVVAAGASVEEARNSIGAASASSLESKVDKVSGKGLSTNDYTTAEKNKLAGIASGATANSTDAQLRDRATHTGTQAISTITGLQGLLDGKAESANLKPVAFSGNYLDLTNRPSLGTAAAYNVTLTGTETGRVPVISDATYKATFFRSDTFPAGSGGWARAVVGYENSEASNKSQAFHGFRIGILGGGDTYSKMVLSFGDNSNWWNQPNSLNIYPVGGADPSVGPNTILHAGNYTNYAPTKTGTGASGTWPISVTGNAATASAVAWNNVTGKPAVIAAGADQAAARAAIGAVSATDLATKVDKVTGKQLSTEDYTTAEKTKLAGIAAGANNYTHPATHPASIIVQDANNRFVTDAEKATWNGKVGVDGSGASGTWDIDISGSASYANKANSAWSSATINSSASGYEYSAVIRSAGGTGDSALAALAFHCHGYGVKLYARADGYFGLGGWSSPAWRWYSDPDGNIVASGNVTAYSDPLLKDKFTRIKDPLELVSQLEGGVFEWRTGFPHTSHKAGKRDYGVLADQVEAVFPEIVSRSIEIDGESYRTVAYEKLIPLLIEAVKELSEKVKILEKS